MLTSVLTAGLHLSRLNPYATKGLEWGYLFYFWNIKTHELLKLFRVGCYVGLGLTPYPTYTNARTSINVLSIPRLVFQAWVIRTLNILVCAGTSNCNYL